MAKKAISIELKLNPLTKIKARFHLDDTGRKKVASEVKRLCDPYVPKDTGDLKNTAQVLTDGVLYDQPYAAKQYEKNSGWQTPRGPHWDKRMMADKGDQLVKAIDAFCKGKSK